VPAPSSTTSFSERPRGDPERPTRSAARPYLREAYGPRLADAVEYAPMRTAALSDALERTVGNSVPGVAMAVVGPEGIRELGSTGLADVVSGTAASPQMICPWFSMTKIVTATAAMRLAERGVLDLDEPILPSVPSMRHLEPATLAERITARHLLSHSAGLTNPIPVAWIHPADRSGPDPDTFLDGLLAKHRKLRFDPGTRSSYSNLGTLVLGSAMASLSGEPYVDLVREEVLEPVGMTMTGFTCTEESVPLAATGHHPRWSPMRLLLPRWVIGSSAGRWVSFRRFLLDGSAYGGLLGSVADAARFVQLHLRDGEVGGTRLLSADSTSAMRDIATPGWRFDLGLGWFRPADQRNADPPFVEHLGGGAGFFNVMRIYPSRGVGCVVMGNATKYDIDAVAGLALARSPSSRTP
jgi:CubicO group peptidase (beta-lactamase class C family)